MFNRVAWQGFAMGKTIVLNSRGLIGFKILFSRWNSPAETKSRTNELSVKIKYSWRAFWFGVQLLRDAIKFFYRSKFSVNKSLFCLLLVFTQLASSESFAIDKNYYKLGSQDRLQIRVFISAIALARPINGLHSMVILNMLWIARDDLCASNRQH